MNIRPALCLPLLLMMAPGPADARQDASVRVYRCVGSNGAVSLQDAPCSGGKKQEVRDMQRPRDPPPRAVRSDRSPAATPAPAAPAREVRYVHVQPPQPMYECVTEEGERYVSDNNEGNPRWVPIWTSVYLPGGHGMRPPGGGGGHPPRPLPPVMPMSSGAGSVSSSGAWLSVSGQGSRVGGSLNLGRSSSQWQGESHRRGGYVGDVVMPAGNVLVRDQCHALPEREVCARLQDQRWDLVRRYNSALQGERDALNREQRGIDARLARDCGT